MQADIEAFIMQQARAGRTYTPRRAGNQHIFSHSNAMRVLLIISLLLSLNACEQQPQLLDKLPQNAMIVAFGDSLTYGTGVAQPQSYPSILAQLTGRYVINAGVPGEITRNGLKRLPSVLNKYQPDLLILIHGGNDLIRRVPEQQTMNNLSKMIDEAQRRDIDVVLLGVPRPGLLFMASAEFYQQLSETFELANDLETLPDILASTSLKSDLVHPNAQGYRIIAENIHQLLQQHGAL